MNALWQPHLWSGLLRVQVVPHSPIPNGTVVWFKFSQGRYLVQAALKQGRVHKQKQQWRSRARFNTSVLPASWGGRHGGFMVDYVNGVPVWSEPGEA